jgi:hypothetical protein
MPEDKVRVHSEIFQLCYNSNGGFTHDEVYSMPVFLRYFYLKSLVEQREKENKAAKDVQSTPSNTFKGPSKFIPKKPS